ncbi:MAG: DUF4911 domain-containing protein [Proteobacteria bacterium]|nr:DUF4911 domain-containing protein [Pseudomonadota bacterium]MBU1649413.1 DUF4911 domain-containing protein [Pseudomonadota bacterium]
MVIDAQYFKELYLAIAPARFHFLKSILEGYDGLAILSSVDGKKGTVRLRYPPESEVLLFDILSVLAPGLNRYA